MRQTHVVTTESDYVTSKSASPATIYEWKRWMSAKNREKTEEFIGVGRYKVSFLSSCWSAWQWQDVCCAILWLWCLTNIYTKYKWRRRNKRHVLSWNYFSFSTEFACKYSKGRIFVRPRNKNTVNHFYLFFFSVHVTCGSAIIENKLNSMSPGTFEFNNNHKLFSRKKDKCGFCLLICNCEWCFWKFMVLVCVILCTMVFWKFAYFE